MTALWGRPHGQSRCGDPVRGRRGDPHPAGLAVPVGDDGHQPGRSLLLGWVSGLVLFHASPAHTSPATLGLIVGTRFCGGHTTFSTASFENVRLLQRGAVWQAIGNTIGTTVLTVSAAGAGLVSAR